MGAATGRDPSPARAAGLEFRILGPLEVVCGDDAVAVRGEKQRTVLAVLVLAANRVVPVDSLIDALWPDRPRTSAIATVQSHVSHVRKALARSGVEEAGDSLVARGGGYVLCAEPAQIDAERFERLVQTARGSVAAGDHAAAGSAFRSALELWRGPALADFVGQQFAQGPSAHLEELRLAAFEELFGATRKRR